MIWQLIYRVTNAVRGYVGIGEDLTAEQIDKNFADLEERVRTIETTPPAANSVVNMTQSGNTITFWLTDGTTTFSATLPGTEIAFLEDGWTPDTGLFANSLFVFERAGFYAVLRDHVTGATFDPNASNESGSLYKLLFDPFSGSAPKTIDENSDALYLPTLTDANKYLIYAGDEDITLQIPTEEDVPFAIGAELHPRQDGAGRIIVRGDEGVTVKPARPGFDTVTPWMGANCSVKKISATVWHYIGPGSEISA